MLGIVFFQDSKSHGTIPPNSDTAIKVATSGGTVLGQLGFGYLADVVGRKKMYGLEFIIIFATLAQALSSSSRAISITGLIILWRVIMVSSSWTCCRNAANTTIRVLESVVTTLSVPLSHLSLLLPNGEVP